MHFVTLILGNQDTGTNNNTVMVSRISWVSPNPVSGYQPILDLLIWHQQETMEVAVVTIRKFGTPVCVKLHQCLPKYRFSFLQAGWPSCRPRTKHKGVMTTKTGHIFI